MYIPSFAFSDKALYKPNSEDIKKRFISSVVFELQEIYDFGIDRLAFYNLESEQLIIEGPFNQMSVHREAFFNSKLDELTIGCYCVECETFVGDCRIIFNQASIQSTFPYEQIQNVDETSNIKSLKLYGVQLGDTVYNKWNLDDVPGVSKLERLEISNSIRTLSASSRRQSSGELVNSIELKSNKNANYPGVIDFYFRNNGLRVLRKKFLALFPNLKYISLAQNGLELIENDAFELTNKKLEEVDLERNKLKKLNRLQFNSLLALKKLSFKDNLIEILEDLSFSSLKNLETLDLSRNKLSALNEKTFDGLSGLKELILSYNPFKKIDSNAFKYLGLQSPLSRLDLISNAESDWFVFDETDICALTYFKCETQIYIDFDQRCNCFVKYLNLVGEKEEQQVESSGESTWFKPCSIEANKNDELSKSISYFEEVYDQEAYVYNKDPALFEKSSGQKLEKIAKIACPKSMLKKCYSSIVGRDLKPDGSDDYLFNSSCLFKKILSSSQVKVGSNKEVVQGSTSTKEIQLSKNSKSANSVENDDGHKLSHNSRKQANEQASSVAASVTADSSLLERASEKAKLSELARSRSVEQSLIEANLKYVLIGLVFVCVISITSFCMSTYLMMKRKSFVYHPTDSSYPPDER